MPTIDPAYFQAIPWCAAQLSDPEYIVVPSRFAKPEKSTKGSFFTHTLAQDTAITACVYQMRRSRHNDPAVTSTQSEAGPRPMVSEVRAFFSTGSGVNGFPGVAHGGFVAAIVDEVMGFLINSNRTATESAASPPENVSNSGQSHQQNVPLGPPGSSVVTAELTIKYRRPVPTGETLLVYAWIEKVEGRKIFVKGTVEGEERQILSEGYGSFVALKPGVKAPDMRERAAKI